MENQEASPEHPLSLYNSLTRRVERFVPQDPSRVTMYNCGPTVYSYAHIGNARAAVVADVLFRVLRHIYGETSVVYARNLTDVDDRIIAAATEQGVPISQITEHFAKVYQDDLAALNCLPPTHEPKATEHITHMIAMIQDLLDRSFAYSSEGHVFFDVSKYPDYGELSGNTLSALRGGDRVGEGEVARKRNAADFVLWKPEVDGVGWDAAFGRGRPGWHIECSAMAKATLGEVIDIHCGGVDLKFPHHENEIAQSCCANGTELMSRYWVHNEFLNMGKDKMSKSLGNVTLVHDLLEDWDGEVIRLALLTANYDEELNWSEVLLQDSKAQLDAWYRIIQSEGGKHKTKPTNGLGFEALRNNLKLRLAVSWMNVCRDTARYGELAKELIAAETKVELAEPVDAVAALLDLGNLLGLLQRDPEDWFRGNASSDDKTRFDALADARHAARKAKDWAEADRIRDEGTEAGIVFEDSADGTSWRKA